MESTGGWHGLVYGDRNTVEYGWNRLHGGVSPITCGPIIVLTQVNKKATEALIEALIVPCQRR